jgi:hypothetical protein
MKTGLSVVPVIQDPATGMESLAQKVRRLQAEAAALACEQVKELERALDQVAKISEEIAEGGEAYPVGARELARRLVEDSRASARTLDVLLSRRH